MLPQCREPDLNREECRLRDVRLLDQRSRFIGQQAIDHRPAGKRPERCVNALDRRPEHGFVFQQFTPHRPPLGTHAREDEHRASGGKRFIAPADRSRAGVVRRRER